MVEKKQDLDVGDEVTAFFATEKFAPVKYFSFDIGPFIYKTKVRSGETADEAMARAYAVVESFARKTYKTKLGEFLDRVADGEEEIDRRADAAKVARRGS